MSPRRPGARSAVVLAAAMALSACGPQGTVRQEAERFVYDPAACVDDIASLPVNPVPWVDPDAARPKAPELVQFKDLAGCVRAGDGLPIPAAVFAVDAPPPLQIDFDIVIEQDIAFAARVDLLTERFELVRSMPFEDFVRRGRQYTGSVFINPGEDIRRIVLVPDSQAVGRVEATTYGVTNTTGMAAPIAGGGVAYFVYNSGSESVSRAWLSEVGPFRIVARPYRLPDRTD